MLWLRYIEDGDTHDQWFDELDAPSKPMTKRENGATLRDVLYSNLISKRRVRDVTIGADELMYETKNSYLETWWCAERIFVAYSSSITVPDDGDFIEIMPMDGDYPVEFIEGHPSLRSVTMTFVPIFPD